MKVLFITKETYIDPDVYKIIVIIFLIVIFLSFFTTMIKYILEHKLKKKMLDQGRSEELITSFLEKRRQETKDTSVKLFLVLLSVGVGLFITQLFFPLGMHSIGIMAISISSAFLIHAGYLHRKGN